VWWRALRQVLDELRVRPAAIGICSQVNTHAFVDERGTAVLPAIVWQDTRCAEVASELGVDASHPLARAEWVRRERPEEWARARWQLSPKDFLNLRLTGEAATDPITPIGLVGADGAYDESAFDLAPDARALQPPIAGFTHTLGDSDGAVVVVATMDAWGNVYGSGLTRVGDAMEVAGTSEILAAVSERTEAGPGIIAFPPVNGLIVHAGPTQAGGDALRWWAELNDLSLDATFAEAADDALGVVFLPHLAGERAPLWDAAARGVFFGLSTDHRRGHLTRALLEGVAFSARHLLEALEASAGVRVDALNASGGGSRSDLWCQIKADVLGCELRRLQVLHTGVLGAALLAGVGAGLLPDLATASRQAARVERVFEPSRDYAEEYGLYRELYPALQPSFTRLAARRSRPAAT
jgi:xylulokinase